VGGLSTITYYHVIVGVVAWRSRCWGAHFGM